MKTAYMSSSYESFAGVREGVKNALSLYYEVKSFINEETRDKLIGSADVFVSILPALNKEKGQFYCTNQLVEFAKNNEIILGKGVFTEIEVFKRQARNKLKTGIIILPIISHKYINRKLYYVVTLLSLNIFELPSPKVINPFDDKNSVSFVRYATLHLFEVNPLSCVLFSVESGNFKKGQVELNTDELRGLTSSLVQNSLSVLSPKNEKKEQELNDKGIFNIPTTIEEVFSEMDEAGLSGEEQKSLSKFDKILNKYKK